MVRTVAAAAVKAAAALAPFAFIVHVQFVWLSLICYGLGALCYRSYLLFVWERGALVGMWLWPFVLLGDAWLTLVSMIRYKTNTVTWKGRPITSEYHSSRE